MRMKIIAQMQRKTALPCTKAAVLESSGSSFLDAMATLVSAVDGDVISTRVELICFLSDGRPFAMSPMLKLSNGMPSITLQKISVEVAGDMSCMNSAASLHFRVLSIRFSIVEVDAKIQRGKIDVDVGGNYGGR